MQKSPFYKILKQNKAPSFTKTVPQNRFDELDSFEPEFWKKKPLEDLSSEEWELLCDGCGKCCLNKLDIRGKICFTNAHCRFLDTETCLCQIYEHRFEKVFDCRNIDLATVLSEPEILPKTCAYRLLVEGKDLPAWHPLITKDADSVHQAHQSLKGRSLISESKVKDYEDYIVDWPDL